MISVCVCTNILFLKFSFNINLWMRLVDVFPNLTKSSILSTVWHRLIPAEARVGWKIPLRNFIVHSGSTQDTKSSSSRMHGVAVFVVI